MDAAEIKASVDIGEIISERIELKHHGSRYYGLCPFHDESAGSFIVFADKQYFKCYGCNEWGDVLDFLQKYHNIDLNTACKLLNPDFKQTRRPQRPTAARSHKALCDALDIWKRLYFDNLEPDRRQKILDYCINNFQHWQRPEHFKLLFFREWKRRMQKHPALMKAWKKNVAEYQMRKAMLNRF